MVTSSSSNSSGLREEKALFSWFGCIDGNNYATSDATRHSESPTASIKEVRDVRI